MAQSNQINLRLTDDKVRLLDEAVDRYGKSRGQIFAELFDSYFEFYVEVEEARLRVLEQQRSNLQRPAGKQKK